jgi:hypothetical protein
MKHKNPDSSAPASFCKAGKRTGFVLTIFLNRATIFDG